MYGAAVVLSSHQFYLELANSVPLRDNDSVEALRLTRLWAHIVTPTHDESCLTCVVMDAKVKSGRSVVYARAEENKNKTIFYSKTSHLFPPVSLTTQRRDNSHIQPSSEPPGSLSIQQGGKC